MAWRQCLAKEAKALATAVVVSAGLDNLALNFGRVVSLAVSCTVPCTTPPNWPMRSAIMSAWSKAWAETLSKSSCRAIKVAPRTFQWASFAWIPRSTASANRACRMEMTALRVASGRSIRVLCMAHSFLSGDGIFDPLLEVGFGQAADARLFQFAVLEDHQGRDAAHAELGRGLRIFVDVDFSDGDLVTHFGRDFIDHRQQHAARAAPLDRKS